MGIICDENFYFLNSNNLVFLVLVKIKKKCIVGIINIIFYW